MAKKIKKVSKIGGQAVLEGVMMRGEHSMATAVRDEFGEIVIESERIILPKEKNKILGIPVIRGVVAFFDSLIKGTKILLKSAEVFGGDMGAPSKFEKWLAEKTKIKVMDIAIFLGLIFGLSLSIGLFFILPTLITDGIVKLFSLDIGNLTKNIIYGALKISIFVGYILLVSLLKDIRRTFMYHGAEHKVINCYEQELELSVENCQKMTTINDRCGTTFIFIVMVVSIIVFSFTGWAPNALLRILTRLLMLPAIAGVSYEILKLFAKSNNFFIRILKSPGLLLQKITTKEPSDEMVEVALAAFNTVQAMDSDKDYPEEHFNIRKSYKSVRDELNDILKDIIKEEAEIDWILAKVTGETRSGLKLLKFIDKDKYDKAVLYAKERAKGIPLQHVLGSADFYGLDILVDENVLIPRPETEILAENAISLSDGKKVLDICTGSGAIALAIKANSSATVTASDISDKAIIKAKENAERNGLEVEFIISDLFEAFKGRKFDVITANPPYIKSSDIPSLQAEVRDYEPMLALDGGSEGMDIIGRIIDQAGNYLSDDGVLLMEVGIGQSERSVELLQEKGYRTEIIKDLEGVDRIVKAVRNV